MTKANKFTFSENTIQEISTFVEEFAAIEKTTHEQFLKAFTKGLHLKGRNVYHMARSEMEDQDVSLSDNTIWAGTALEGKAKADYRSFLALDYKEGKAFEKFIIDEEITSWNAALTAWKRANKATDKAPKSWQDLLTALIATHSTAQENPCTPRLAADVCVRLAEEAEAQDVALAKAA